LVIRAFVVCGPRRSGATGSNPGSNFSRGRLWLSMKRPYGSGQIYEKWGAYYGRWRAPDGRRLNRWLGPKRTPGSADGLTRAQAEQAFRRVQAADQTRSRVDVVAEIVTVDHAAEV